jgi:hypothetical protein
MFPKPQSKTQETFIKAIRINYDLLPNSSLHVYFNQLIHNVTLPVLTHGDCKSVTETQENLLLHTKLENRAVNQPSST